MNKTQFQISFTASARSRRIHSQLHRKRSTLIHPLEYLMHLLIVFDAQRTPCWLPVLWRPISVILQHHHGISRHEALLVSAAAEQILVVYFQDDPQTLALIEGKVAGVGRQPVPERSGVPAEDRIWFVFIRVKHSIWFDCRSNSLGCEFRSLTCDVLCCLGTWGWCIDLYYKRGSCFRILNLFERHRHAVAVGSDRFWHFSYFVSLRFLTTLMFRTFFYH